MTEERLRIVVGGFLGLLPAGGVTWDYVQYPVGLSMLGHDVYYVEDTRLWPVYQAGGADPSDCTENVVHLDTVMRHFGLERRWAYRDEASGRCFGMTLEQVHEICRTADVFVNISCSTVIRDEYRRIPVRILIDSDPMFTQIQYVTEESFTPGASRIRELVAAHTHHFTFAENITGTDCRIPDTSFFWKPTRQPICLEYWPHRPLPMDSSASFTTVMNWTAGTPLHYASERWGQKDVEFGRIFELPKRFTTAPLVVAVGQTQGAGSRFPHDRAVNAGWRVLNPVTCAGNWHQYANFVYESKGEFSVAKETYVKARTGWFSGRSACYLAAGRPVVTQDTGWTSYLPSDCGLLGFDDIDGACRALDEVMRSPVRHGAAARKVAEDFFDSRRVLAELLAYASNPALTRCAGSAVVPRTLSKLSP